MIPGPLKVGRRPTAPGTDFNAPADLTQLPEIAKTFRRPRQLASFVLPAKGGLKDEMVVKAAESALRMLVGLVVTGFVVRRLGIGAFGSFSYVWSIYAIAAPLASLGIDQVIVRAITADPHRTRFYVAQAIRLRLVAGLGATAILLTWLVAAGASSEEMATGLIASVGLLFLVSEVFMAAMQAERGSRRTGRLRLIAFAGSSVLKVAVAVVHPTPAAIALATVSEPAFILMQTLLASNRIAKGSPVQRVGSGPRSTSASLLRDGLPYLLSAASVSLYMRCDVVLLHRWSSANETGRYAAVTRISEVLYFLPIAVCAAATPALLRIFEVNPTACLKRLRKLTMTLCAVAIAFAAVTAAGAPVLLRLAFGDEFGQAAWVLRVHALATIPVFVGVAREVWLLARKKGKISLVTTLSGAAINIGLNFVLIPRYGAMGAAIATAASYTFAVFIAPLAFASGREFFGIRRLNTEVTP